MPNIRKCKRLLARLQRGNSVIAVDLRPALGDERWADYKSLCAWMTGQRREAKKAIQKLGSYVRLLRIADLCDARYSRLRALKFNERNWTRSNWYGRALECLTDLVRNEPALTIYLDRPFSPDYGESDADRESVPRIKYHSDQVLPQPEEATIKTTKQLKWEVLERCIENSRVRSFQGDHTGKQTDSKTLR